MTGYRPGLYWQLTWRYIGPGLMSLLLLASVYGYIKEVPKYKAWDAELVSFYHNKMPYNLMSW
jgi:solute carrier family 6 (neurotransmitter transporter, amino acid/orphan) member 15/16/17/18/20